MSINQAGPNPVSEPTSYDKVPYRSFPFPQSHPDRLATIGTLFGLRPAPLEKSRILELGCASGGNLIPMAEQYPDSTLLGIDSSVQQVTEGQRIIQQLGLTNVELQHLDILDFPLDHEPFDYLICHGVFSWVDDETQRRILEICRRCLTPQGIAYVSYNTYPGWHMRGMIRDIMRYRARPFSTPASQLAQARGLLTFLSNSVKTEDNPYGLLLKRELEAISQCDDSYLIHEHLEDLNKPLYFHELAERAEAAGLQYLGEADFGVMAIDNFPEQVKGMLQSVSRDGIELEQYMDFLRNRAFRQTLLCQREMALQREPRPETLLKLRVASSARPEGEADLAGEATVRYRRGQSVLQTNDPVVKAAMGRLRESWPASIPFTELAAMARSAVMSRPIAVTAEIMTPVTEQLARTMLRCFATAQVDLHTAPPTFVLKVSDRPQASPLARLQAEAGARVTNRLHETVTLDDFQRQILCELDGTQERDPLVAKLHDLIQKGKLIIHHDNRRLANAEEIRSVLDETFASTLETLARLALLVG